MAVSDSYRIWMLEQLGRVVPVTSRRMFGGLGLYARGFFFALVDDDVLYFKVDDENRPQFEAEGMGPFRPFGDEGGAMQYYEVPGSVLEDLARLREWTDAALAVAARARRRKRR